MYIFTTEYLGEFQVRIFVVQHQIRILMVFVSVVVLEVIEPVVFRVPSFDHHTFVVIYSCLQKFLDS